MRLPRPGLFGRLVIALVAATLLPLAVVAYMVGLSSAAITDQLLRTHALAARTTAARVDAFLDGLRRAADAVARNPALYADAGSGTARELVAGLLQAQPLVVGAAVIAPGGQEVFRVQSRARAEVVQAVLAAPGGEALVPRRELSTWWIRLETELPEGAGRLRLVADASLLENVLETEELGREAAIALVSASSGLIVTSTPDLRLEEFPGPLVEAGRSGRLSGSSRYDDRQGASTLGAWAPVDGTDWYVLSRQPAEVAEDVAAAVRQRALLVGLGALAFTTVVAAVAWRTVVSPLRQVAGAQQRLAHARGPERGADEIEQLRVGLAALERQTLDRQAIGKVFLGRYLVLELIGSGGMGSVFRGFDPRLQREVALKTIHLGSSPGEDGVDQRSLLLKEAVTVARFSHPHIVAVYDVEDSGQVAFIAMELVDGTNLADVLDSRGALGPEQAVPLGTALAEALAAAHARGIVHRDLKPANVLLGRDGSVKLTDFGVADRIASLRSGSVFGTPGYIAPEAVAGGPQDARADLFALGVVLWETMAGRPLFRGETVQETFVLTASRAAPGLRSLQPRVPGEVDRLVAGLLEKKPDLRSPGTAAEAARALSSVMGREGWTWSLDGLETTARGNREVVFGSANTA